MKNKKITFINLVTIVALILFFYKISSAQSNLELTATPEVFQEAGAKFLLTEINLKNKENDWIEFYYESPSKKPLNIKNFQFKDDNTFKKVAQDFWINSGEYYRLEFKKTESDNQSEHILYSERTGLTATTEQIAILEPNGKIIDAVCWANTKPTADEIKDTQDLFEGEGWISANTDSCIPSDKISTNQSLIRSNFKDTDSINDWSVTDDVTPGKANDSVQNTNTPQNETVSPLSLSTNISTASSSSSNNSATYTPSKSSITKTPTSTKSSNTTQTTTKSTTPKTSKKTSTPKSTSKKTTTKKSINTKSKSKTPQYKNGDLSENIVISEILPRATTDDKHNEWIELSNIGDEEVNLGNWQLDDEDGGSKPYIIPDTITLAAQSAVIFKAPDTKLSLSNTKDAVRLFDPSGELVQTIEYEEAPKAESYAAIHVTQLPPNPEIKNEPTWVWESKPTPGELNPEYIEMTGTISNDADFTSSLYSFELQTEDNQRYHTVFEESLVAGPMAKATFVKGTQIKIMGPLGTEPNSLLLKKYEVLTTITPENQEQNWPWGLTLLLIPATGAVIYLKKKKMKTKAFQVKTSPLKAASTLADTTNPVTL